MVLLCIFVTLHFQILLKSLMTNRVEVTPQKIQGRRSIRPEVDYSLIEKMVKKRNEKRKNNNRNPTPTKDVDKRLSTESQRSLSPDDTNDSDKDTPDFKTQEDEIKRPSYTPECAVSSKNGQKPRTLEEEKKKLGYTPEGAVSFENGQKASQTKSLFNKFTKQSFTIPATVFIVIIGIVVMCCINWSSGTHTIREFNISKSIEELSVQYPSQPPSTWDRLNSGLQDIKRDSRPSVFVLLHSGNQKIANEMAIALENIAANYLNHTGKLGGDPVILKPDLLNTLGHGDLMYKYEHQVRERGALVILDLESVRGTVAQGLHHFCDEHTLLIPEAAIILTVDLLRCGVSLKESSRGSINTEKAEDCLSNNWKDLPSHFLQPLLVRVVSTVLHITPET